MSENLTWFWCQGTWYDTNLGCKRTWHGMDLGCWRAWHGFDVRKTDMVRTWDVREPDMIWTWDDREPDMVQTWNLIWYGLGMWHGWDVREPDICMVRIGMVETSPCEKTTSVHLFLLAGSTLIATYQILRQPLLPGHSGQYCSPQDNSWQKQSELTYPKEFSSSLHFVLEIVADGL